MFDALCYILIKSFESMEQSAYAVIDKMYNNPKDFFSKVYSFDDVGMGEPKKVFLSALNMFMTLEQKLDFLSVVEKDKGAEYKESVKEFFTLQKNPRVE